jgi:hypothetical protein
MPEEDKNKLPTEEDSKLNEELTSDESEDVDEFDFGGLPEDTPFKRNIGCGG